MAEYPAVTRVYKAPDRGAKGFPNNETWRVRGLDAKGQGFSMAELVIENNSFGVTLEDGSFLVIPADLLPTELK